MRILSRCLFSFAYNTIFPPSFRLFFLLLTLHSPPPRSKATGKISSQEKILSIIRAPSGVPKHFERVCCYCCPKRTLLTHVRRRIPRVIFVPTTRPRFYDNNNNKRVAGRGGDNLKNRPTLLFSNSTWSNIRFTGHVLPTEIFLSAFFKSQRDTEPTFSVIYKFVDIRTDPR